MRQCKCGCGEELTNSRWDYKRGHKPKQEQPADKPAVATQEPVEDTAYNINLTLTDAQVEMLWQTLTPLQKANGLAAALQN